MSSLLEKSRDTEITGCDTLLNDGGVGTGEGDLWATYAAIRTMKWIESPIPQSVKLSCAEYLAKKQNPDGGFAWQAGLPSDIWATYYATEALCDLGFKIENGGELLNWLRKTQNANGGFSMIPGQSPEVWATYYASRLFPEIFKLDVPNSENLTHWIRSLQDADGGITWAPGHHAADIRAFYYASRAFLFSHDNAPLPWDIDRLLTWIDRCRHDQRGYSFTPDDTPCLWATFRATTALAHARLPIKDKANLVNWIYSRLSPEGFTRWEDYPVSDVWANFTAIGSLKAMSYPVDPSTKEIVRASLEKSLIETGGYTYRENAFAGDALSTAATLLAGTGLMPNQRSSLVKWLQNAAMPFEGGVMYMPGRGSEVRCTLWAIAACQSQNAELSDSDPLARWLGNNQNPDGGVGYWLGRGSDVTSTVATLAALELLGVPANKVLNLAKIREFLELCVCGTHKSVSVVPGGPTSTAALAMAARAYSSAGYINEGAELAQTLPTKTILGGFASDNKSISDLATTYQVIATKLRFGIDFDQKALRKFLKRLQRDNGSFAWTPISPVKGDLLAQAMGSLLLQRIDGDGPLPELVI